MEVPGENNLSTFPTSEIWILDRFYQINIQHLIMKYLVGITRGSSLTVPRPSFDPKYVKSFIRATAPTRQKEKRKADGGSKLNNAEQSIFAVLEAG